MSDKQQYRDPAEYYGMDSDDDVDKKYGELNPLQLAAKEGNLDQVKQIVQEGKVDINANNFERYNAVTLAAEFEHWDVVVHLMENQANLDNYTTDAFHISPLYHAVLQNNLEMVKTLVLNGAKVNEAYSGNHEHLLHLVVRRGADKDMIRTLIEAKAVVNPQLPDGRKDTPLSLALLDGDIDTVQLLQKYGGQVPNSTDPEAIKKGLYGFIEISKNPKASFECAFAMVDAEGKPLYGAESIALGLYGCLRSRKQTGDYIKQLLDYDQKHKFDAVNSTIGLSSSWISLLVGFDEAKTSACMGEVKGDDEKQFTPYELAVIKNKQEYVDLIKPFANEENIKKGDALAAALNYQV